MPKPTSSDVLPIKTPIPYDLEEIMGNMTDQLSKKNKNLYTPIRTGMDQIDDLTGGGIFPGELRLIGGMQNVGKTALVVQQLDGIARYGNALAILVCYEHLQSELFERLFCQTAYKYFGGEMLTVKRLQDEYIRTVDRGMTITLEQQQNGDFGFLSNVLKNVPNGMKTFKKIVDIWHRVWILTGDGQYTDPETLQKLIDYGLTFCDRVVMIVDYLQIVPYYSQHRELTRNEKTAFALEALKSHCMRKANLEGKFAASICVASADEEGLRNGRVHMENLSGDPTVQYRPNTALIMNRDLPDPDGVPTVRIGLEKNRKGPSDIEFRHRYYGAAYTIDYKGEELPYELSWQSERRGLQEDLKKREAELQREREEALLTRLLRQGGGSIRKNSRKRTF